MEALPKRLKNSLPMGYPVLTRSRMMKAIGVAGLMVALGLAGLLVSLRSHGTTEPYAIAPIQPRPGSAASEPGIAVVKDASAAGAGTQQAGQMATSPDPRLIEQTRFGLLPRIGSDGSRPSQVYARPASAVEGPRVAILVTGLGVSQSATVDAIARLPEAVSLAFGPYGADLERLVGQARDAGHEVMLQVPMEPFDNPDNDPGPHKLIPRAPVQENLQRLHWVMGRFTGYTGLVNTAGARLVGDETAFGPIRSEIAGRGLIFLDDSSPARTNMAPGTQGPTDGSRILLDSVPRAEAIDHELERLESLARERGVAIATAGPGPISVERIARWAKTLAGKNIHLVPVSNAFEKHVRP